MKGETGSTRHGGWGSQRLWVIRDSGGEGLQWGRQQTGKVVVAGCMRGRQRGGRQLQAAVEGEANSDRRRGMAKREAAVAGNREQLRKRQGVVGQRGRQFAARGVERACSGMLHATVNGHVFQHANMINFSRGRSPFMYRRDPKPGKCRGSVGGLTARRRGSPRTCTQSKYCEHYVHRWRLNC